MARKSTSTKKRSTSAAKPRNGSVSAKPKSKGAAQTKTDIILGMLRRKAGASVEEMAAATGWQAHSVRGFLSGTVKKKLRLKLADEKPEGGARRYFVRAS